MIADTVKRYLIAGVIALMIVLMIACGILYKRTVALKDDNNELTTQITTLTSANESLQTEIVKRQAVEQITNSLNTQLNQVTEIIEQSARKTQNELHNSLKTQPCATTNLPDDVYRMLNPGSAHQG